MKTKFLHTLLFITFICCTINSAAQTSVLWGTTSTGGANSGGTIFKINPDGTGFITVHSFSSSTEHYPGSLTKGPNKLLYGTTKFGNSKISSGVLFSIDPSTNAYMVVHVFSVAEGSPRDLFLASDGKLYGMTFDGGVSKYGILFSFDPAINVFTKIFEFSGYGSGAQPQGKLMQASNGLLYGMTLQGGTYNGGVLFGFNIANNTYNKLYDFRSITGSPRRPYGSLIQDGSDGLLWGLTTDGGNYEYSALFAFNLINKAFITASSFRRNIEPKGFLPLGSLVRTTPGNFYGMTKEGGANNRGVLFFYNTLLTQTLTEVEFNGADNGAYPFGSLIKVSDGKLYGLTIAGGVSDKGVVFNFNTQDYTLTKIHDFTGSDGANPAGDLLEMTCTAPPAAPGAITGKKSVCNGNTVTYSVAAVAGAKSYTWSSPAGSVIKSGQGTNTIRILWGSTGGSIKVYASNDCGNSAKSSKKITVNNCFAKIADNTSAIKQESNFSDMKLEIFPNPSQADKSVTVKFSSNIYSQYNIKVIDITGKTLLTEKGQANKGINLVSLQAANLSKGIYFIVLNGNGSANAVKLIVE